MKISPEWKRGRVLGNFHNGTRVLWHPDDMWWVGYQYDFPRDAHVINVGLGVTLMVPRELFVHKHYRARLLWTLQLRKERCSHCGNPVRRCDGTPKRVYFHGVRACDYHGRFCPDNRTVAEVIPPTTLAEYNQATYEQHTMLRQAHELNTAEVNILLESIRTHRNDEQDTT